MDSTTAHNLFAYDPSTGDLHWKIRASQRVRPGDRAGSPDGHGYLTVRVKKKNWKVHRIVWLMSFGELPKGMIDHINGDRSDNRIANLRDATPKENAQNLQSCHKDSKSGILGVSPYRNKWVAHLTVNGKHKRIGTFSNAEDAGKAYQKAKAESLNHPFTTATPN